MAWTQPFVNNLETRPKDYKVQEDNLIIRIKPSGYKGYYAYIGYGLKAVHLGNHPELTLKEAKIKKNELYHDKYMGKLEETNLSFKEYTESEDFIDWSIGFRDSHELRMDSLNQVINPIIGSIKIRDLSQQHITRFINKRKAKGTANSTINRNLTDIRAVLRHAHDNEMIHKLIKIKSLKEDQVRERRPLTKLELKKLREACRDHGAYYEKRKHLPVIVDLALETGGRKNEILQLEWGDIIDKGMTEEEVIIPAIGEDDELREEARVLLRNSGANETFIRFRGTTTKTKQTRLVPISEQMTLILKNYYMFDWQGPTEYADKLNKITKDGVIGMNLFFEEDKKKKLFPMKDIKTTFNNAKRKAGLDDDITFHNLRHHYCSMAIASGMDLHYVKELAGHHSIKTTELYLSTQYEEKRIQQQRYIEYLGIHSDEEEEDTLGKSF